MDMRHLCIAVLLLISPLQLHAETIRFTVQPILDRDQALKAYRPLVQYLKSETGLDVQMIASVNFLTYWQQMLKGEFDMILDAAHFTAYRMENEDYTPIAKLPGTVTYSLVTSPDLLILEPWELIGKKVATNEPPSLAMVRLLEMYPNPLRQPVFIESNSSERALRLIEAEKVDAAIVPTPLLNAFPDLNVVTTTDPAPHMTFSVAPSVSEEARQKLRDAMLNAVNSDKGKAMLAKINFESFESPEGYEYEGYEELLKDTWGY
jgi:phosphonate transport system substrate-binding protein